MASYSTERAYINYLYADLRRKCRIRNRILDLDVKDLKKFIFKNCSYCGSPPEIRTNGANKVVQLATNGVDRVDSSIGYIKSNCVPCCSKCNSMKSNLELKDFLEQVRRISVHTEKNANKGG